MDLYYVVTGVEDGYPFILKFTLKEVVKNVGALADTELFYSLYEDLELWAELKMFEDIELQLNRDNERCKGIVCRIPYEIYKKVEIKTNDDYFLCTLK